MTKPKPKRRQRDRYKQDMRIKDATPEALTKVMFGGAKPRPETKPEATQPSP